MIECTSSKAVRNLQFSMCKSCTQLAPDEQLFEGQSQGWHELILQPSGPAASNFPLPAVSKYVQCPTVQTVKRMSMTESSLKHSVQMVPNMYIDHQHTLAVCLADKSIGMRSSSFSHSPYKRYRTQIESIHQLSLLIIANNKSCKWINNE